MGNLLRAARSALAFFAHALRASGAAPPLDLLTQVVIVVVCVGTATLVRWAIGLAVPGVVPFATYFPAIAFAALLGGFWPGVWTWLLSIGVGIFLFMETESWPYLTAAQATSAVLFAGSAALELLIASLLRDLFWQSRKNESRYRALVDASANLVSVFDGSGACREPQKGWEELTGVPWPRYSAMGWLDSVHEDDRAKILNHSGNKTPSELEVRIWDAARNDWRWFALRAVPLFDLDGNVEERIGALTDITERKSVHERRELLLEDLRHRLKNFIAVIQALVNAATPKGNAEVTAFAQTFLHRVRALQSAGDLVMKANGLDVDLAEVVPAALAPFFGDSQPKFSIDGGPLLLKEQTVGGIALACHELATNAAKYGALASNTGTVAISWHNSPEPDGERVTFEWIERGGPKVERPTRQGFGTRIVKAAVSREAKGEVTLDYRPDGLVCRMTFIRTTMPVTAITP